MLLLLVAAVVVVVVGGGCGSGRGGGGGGCSVGTVGVILLLVAQWFMTLPARHNLSATAVTTMIMIMILR